MTCYRTQLAARVKIRPTLDRCVDLATVLCERCGERLDETRRLRVQPLFADTVRLLANVKHGNSRRAQLREQCCERLDETRRLANVS